MSVIVVFLRPLGLRLLKDISKKIGGFAQTAAKKSSDIAQTAAKKSGEIAQNAAKKSGEIVEVTKLNKNIANEENAIEKLYSELGKLYYNSIESGTDFDAGVAGICKKIKEHKENIVALKEKIRYRQKDGGHGSWNPLRSV